MIGRRNLTGSAPFRYDVHRVVFPASALLIFVFVAIAVFVPGSEALFAGLKDWLAGTLGWVFVAVMNLMLVAALWFGLGPHGTIRLGGPDAEPEFSTAGWFAMLFSAGMGIGLLFYGVAEPMYHFGSPPTAEPETLGAAKEAMRFTFLHWGLHPWAVYTIVGLALAYFAFNRGMPLSIRSAFSPVLGDRVFGWPGDLIDILATVATMFGVATSLGLGVKQVNAGLHYVSSEFAPVTVPETTGVQIALIAGITAMATLSVVRGLEGGIQVVSVLNMVLAGALLLFVFVVGPTGFLLDSYLENIGMYLQRFAWLSTWSEAWERTSWQDGWTIFYYAWWIAWSPFVGMFIARVSYGRTIREFVLGVMLVPTLVTFFWMTVFGNTALHIELFGAGGIAAAVAESLPVSLFVFLDGFPLSWLSCSLATLVVVTFFVTSSDSGSLVIDILTAGGKADPPIPQRVFWAVLEGVVAAALMLGGGLVALQSAAISTGLPFAVVLVLMAWSLARGLSEDRRQAEELAVQQIERNEPDEPVPSLAPSRLDTTEETAASSEASSGHR